MAQAIRIFRENGLARQRLEKERDADWAIRDLLARMTQRLQVARILPMSSMWRELFAPEYCPRHCRAVLHTDREPANALRAQWLSPQGKADAFHPDECWLRAAARATLRYKVNLISPATICRDSCQQHTLCVPLIAQEKPSVCSHSRTLAMIPPSRAYLELMAEALGLALANQRLRDALLEKALYDPLTGLRNRHHLEDTFYALR